MKKIFSFVLMSLVSLVFIVSCSDDDDEKVKKSEFNGIWRTSNTGDDADYVYYCFSESGSRYEEFTYYNDKVEESLEYFSGSYTCSGGELVTFIPDYFCYSEFSNKNLTHKETDSNKNGFIEDSWMTAYKFIDGSNTITFGPVEFEKVSPNDPIYANIRALLNKTK